MHEIKALKYTHDPTGHKRIKINANRKLRKLKSKMTAGGTTGDLSQKDENDILMLSKLADSRMDLPVSRIPVEK